MTFLTVATATGIVLSIAAALWGFVRFVFEPRLLRLVESMLKPVADRLQLQENRIASVETAQSGVESSIEKIGTDIRDGMKDLAAAIRELAEKHAMTAEEVAEIRGRLDTPKRGGRKR